MTTGTARVSWKARWRTSADDDRLKMLAVFFLAALLGAFYWQCVRPDSGPAQRRAVAEAALEGIRAAR